MSTRGMDYKFVLCFIDLSRPSRYRTSQCYCTAYRFVCYRDWLRRIRNLGAKVLTINIHVLNEKFVKRFKTIIEHMTEKLYSHLQKTIL